MSKYYNIFIISLVQKKEEDYFGSMQLMGLSDAVMVGKNVFAGLNGSLFIGKKKKFVVGVYFTVESPNVANALTEALVKIAADWHPTMLILAGNSADSKLTIYASLVDSNNVNTALPLAV